MSTVTVIHCWSAPRSRSTALLYAFEARNDCIGIDEPLYREYLISKGKSVTRPYLQALISGIPPEDTPPEEEYKWKRELLSLTERIAEAAKKLKEGVIFCKHIAKQSGSYDFANECVEVDGINIIHRHLMLIRDPVDVLLAWGKVGGVHGNNATVDEVGVVPMLDLYSKLESRNDNNSLPVVLESDELAINPEEALSTVCSNLNISYTESMLSWPSGPHSTYLCLDFASNCNRRHFSLKRFFTFRVRWTMGKVVVPQRVEIRGVVSRLSFD